MSWPIFFSYGCTPIGASFFFGVVGKTSDYFSISDKTIYTYLFRRVKESCISLWGLILYSGSFHSFVFFLPLFPLFLSRWYWRVCYHVFPFQVYIPIDSNGELFYGVDVFDMIVVSSTSWRPWLVGRDTRKRWHISRHPRFVGLSCYALRNQL